MPVLPEVGSMMTEPGLQLTRSLRVVDHFLRNAVLDGTGGVEVFKFGQDSGLEVQLFFDVCQLQQGSLADQHWSQE